MARLLHGQRVSGGVLPDLILKELVNRGDGGTIDDLIASRAGPARVPARLIETLSADTAKRTNVVNLQRGDK